MEISGNTGVARRVDPPKILPPLAADLTRSNSVEVLCTWLAEILLTALGVGKLGRNRTGGASHGMAEGRTMAAGGNADQIAYWNADAGEVWAALQEHLDAQLEPHGSKAIEALAPGLGERIIDLGCGSGQTSLALGQPIGSCPSSGILRQLAG